MAIVKASGRVSRLDGDVSPEMISADDSDDEAEAEASTGDESDPSDADSGMGSDEFDLSELGEANAEFCQVGSQSFSVPIELYGLPDLGSVLSLETWNECLTEEERFGLSEFLPDMDQGTLARTLSALFDGKDFHFGSPIHDLFKKLKGGMLDPRVVLYRRGLSFFKKREQYHMLRKYQNSMVGGLVMIRDAWRNCSGYGIEERLRLLSILRSQRSLVSERNGNVGWETDSESSEDGLFDERFKMNRPALEPMRPVKDNAKGILKVTPPKFSSNKEHAGVSNRYPLSGKHGFHKNGKASKARPVFSQQDRFDSGSYQQAWGQKRRGYEEEEAYEDDNDDDVFKEKHHALETRASLSKSGKKKLLLKQNANGMKSGFGDVEFMAPVGMSKCSSKSRIADLGVTIAAYNPHSLETMSNAKYPAKDWMRPVNDRLQHKVQKGNQVDWSTCDQPNRHGKTLGEVSNVGPQVKAEERSVKSKKWKSEDSCKSGKSRTGLDLTVRSYKTSPAQISDTYAMTSHGKFKGISAYNGGIGMEYPKSEPMFFQSDETESDSSEKLEKADGGMSPYLNKGHPMATTEGRQLGDVETMYHSKMGRKIMTADKKVHSSICASEMEPYSSRGKHKSKTAEPSYMENSVLVKRTQTLHSSGRVQQSWQKSYSADKKWKAAVDLDHSSEPNYMHDYGNGILDENTGYLDGRSQYIDGKMQTNISGNRYQVTDLLTSEVDHYGISNMSLLGCNSVARKRKGNAEVMNQYESEESVYPQSSPMQQIDEPNFIKKKGKRKVDAVTAPFVVTPDMTIPEKEMAEVEPEPKPQKKPFTLITPSKHTGFSFSIIHLLSAIRKAMITPCTEDAVDTGYRLANGDGALKPKGEGNEVLRAVNGTDPSEPSENMDVNVLEPGRQNNLPSHTVQEIVDRVRTNPGDPCILETEEPLQDLVRGVLKIFSSKTAPLGAKGWKAIVLYEKSSKSWSWIGPFSSSSSDNDTVEEETSPEAWALPHKTLVKLVDSFANWLKSGQETLKQIGSLPPPPTAMLAQLDEKERFRDLRAQKSLSTISPSSEEVREYFRKEELLRYSIPDRAFSYTAADGKKSIVAPLRRGGGKPTSKARDHFMLKSDRPPHVTILCLVRDAAARLPGSIGTRADVCTLIRDSQYIVDDVTDERVNQVVSGALDRLHYERDPCVQFDGDRKLWGYLHRDREEEDFEDDGTSSTKKWKRPRKDAADQPETGAGNDASYPMTGDPAVGGSGGFDVNPELTADASSVQAGTENMPVYDELRSNMQALQSYIDPSSGGEGQINTMTWVPLGLNSLCENKMLCQENSTNEDFDDEAFGTERPDGLLSDSLL